MQTLQLKMGSRLPRTPGRTPWDKRQVPLYPVDVKMNGQSFGRTD